MTAAPTDAAERRTRLLAGAEATLRGLAGVLDPLAERFTAAGHELHLVGGSVRDAVLGRLGTDLDLTTDARPEQVQELLRGWARAQWDTGIAFGTVSAARDGQQVEITTYRADAYDRVTRNPEVVYGTSLTEDLLRRDFAVNAMAVRLGPHRAFVDPHGGLDDLVAGVLDTPGAPEDSFADDPLRMLRAARFVSQLGFAVAPRVRAAMTAMAPEIGRITAERVRAELDKLLCGEHPGEGIDLLVTTGLAEHVLPEVPAMRLEIDEHHQHKDVYAHSLTVLQQAIDLELADPAHPSPDLVLRWAALLHDIGKPATRRHEDAGGVSFHHHEVVGAKMARKRLRALKHSKQVTDDVAHLVFLHLRFHGYGGGEWTDSAVRRYVTDAGPQLDQLHKLVRADSTTRNARRAAALQATYDDLEARIDRIAADEDLARVRPDLDGNAIMELLGVPAGPVVGKAWKHLKELRLDRGPLSRDDAETALREWARTEGLTPACLSGNRGAGPGRPSRRGLQLRHRGRHHHHVDLARGPRPRPGRHARRGGAGLRRRRTGGRRDVGLRRRRGGRPLGAGPRRRRDGGAHLRRPRWPRDVGGRRGRTCRRTPAAGGPAGAPAVELGWTDLAGVGHTAPLVLDSDADGVADLAPVDVDRDGRTDDAVGDADGDGVADLVLLDRDDDGYRETTGTDTDLDGTPDTQLVDADADGSPDGVLRAGDEGFLW